MSSLRIEAPAKINLSLEVIERRDDGYHNLISVMQCVSLCDVLTISNCPDVVFSCSDRSLSNQDNLVYKAAVSAKHRFGVTQGCAIHLEKRIPTAAGLGGGSSDAAAALVGLSRFWGVEASCRQLQLLAEDLGSDVPFFLYGGTAIVQGRGEFVSALPQPKPQTYVVAKPHLEISTGDMFRRLSPSHRTSGATTHRVAASIEKGVPVQFGVNAFQSLVVDAYPQVRTCVAIMDRLSSGRTLLSGSGPTIMGMFDDHTGASTAVGHLRSCGFWAEVVAHLATPDRPCAS